jgi:hypothetical protein
VLRRRVRAIYLWLVRRRAGLVLLPWLAVAANAVQAKYNQILMQAVSDALVGAPPFAIRNHLYQFRFDLLFGFVIVPFVLVQLLRWIGWRWVLLTSSIAAMAWQIVMSAEMATYAMANNYATFRTMVMAFIWAVQHPKNQFLTLPFFDKIYAVGGMMLVAMLIALVYAIPHGRKVWWSRAGVVLCGICALTLVPTAPAKSHGPESSIFRDVATSLVEHNDSQYMKMSVPELMTLAKAETGLPELNETTLSYAGKAKDYNVIFMVMESMSAEVVDPARDSLDDMPNTKRLRQTAFVGSRHFTSYPLTNRASFGIFTSLYTESALGIAVGDRGVKLPGMIRNLDAAGYTTGYFGYIWRDEEERDDSMMDALGFDRIEDPQAKADELPAAELMFGGPVLKAAEKDHEALVLLRKSIKEWTSKKQKFAAAFFPEVGHDPWRNITTKENPSVWEAGHALAVHQDGFLGEIIDELKKDGALENTIIVLTADHGQRTEQDDDGNEMLISKGKIDDRTMRVPFMMYVPRVLSNTVTLQGPTSHIDIEPSVLSLLGVENAGKLQEGIVMWNPNIGRRRLYLSMKVFGAKGYYENGYFYSANQGGVFKTTKLPFTSALPWDSEEVKRVRAIVEQHSALQAALVDHLANEKP